MLENWSEYFSFWKTNDQIPSRPTNDQSIMTFTGAILGSILGRGRGIMYETHLICFKELCCVYRERICGAILHAMNTIFRVSGKYSCAHCLLKIIYKCMSVWMEVSMCTDEKTVSDLKMGSQRVVTHVGGSRFNRIPTL